MLLWLLAEGYIADHKSADFAFSTQNVPFQPERLSFLPSILYDLTLSVPVANLKMSGISLGLAISTATASTLAELVANAEGRRSEGSDFI